MSYYGGKQLSDAFRTVRKNTIIIAQEIGEEHYGFRATPETRSIAQTLMHIALMPQFAEQIHAIERRTTMEGFDFLAFFARREEEEQKARTKPQILDFLRTEGDRMAAWMASVTDDFLAETVAFPAAIGLPPRTRFEMLLGVKEHEMHHRAQLMLMERLIGIVPHLTRESEARRQAMLAPQRA